MVVIEAVDPVRGAFVGNVRVLATKAKGDPAVLDDPQIPPELRDAAKAWMGFGNETPPQDDVETILVKREAAIRARSDL